MTTETILSWLEAFYEELFISANLLETMTNSFLQDEMQHIAGERCTVEMFQQHNVLTCISLLLKWCQVSFLNVSK